MSVALRSGFTSSAAQGVSAASLRVAPLAKTGLDAQVGCCRTRKWLWQAECELAEVPLDIWMITEMVNGLVQTFEIIVVAVDSDSGKQQCKYSEQSN